ncbi:carbon storage regulator CsrA [candidate division KSB1 bacterium]|nr:carbon storage regulator CsrA [candidate division KSB1 bacterium]NIR70406.1 carbon storage regulator CsrA [candidate division KSB1 bacterium]NIS25946.1 carbon storage regulator CsrA [candidate division KSB1 bacterium]NIT69969.1 carbon storage regulator CsrA [candidate division KSB1 bacterium]NIU26634.1 carbon storage regulator CsrA [candidate division KSB1 bacterium]
MLVLTRKLGETIVIGDDIVIKVVDIHGKQIRLGIEAPTEISIFRGEIYERIQEENKKAQKTDKPDKPKKDDEE